MFPSSRFEIQNRYNKYHEPGAKFANEIMTSFRSSVATCYLLTVKSAFYHLLAFVLVISLIANS